MPATAEAGPGQSQDPDLCRLQLHELTPSASQEPQSWKTEALVERAFTPSLGSMGLGIPGGVSPAEPDVHFLSFLGADI